MQMKSRGDRRCHRLMIQQRTTEAVHHAHKRILPYHVYSTAELRVEQHRQGNGLPQVVTGYDPDPIQATLIQSVPQELIRSVKQEDGEQRRHGFTTGLCLVSQYLLPSCKTQRPGKFTLLKIKNIGFKSALAVFSAGRCRRKSVFRAVVCRLKIPGRIINC